MITDHLLQKQSAPMWPRSTVGIVTYYGGCRFKFYPDHNFYLSLFGANSLCRANTQIDVGIYIHCTLPSDKNYSNLSLLCLLTALTIFQLNCWHSWKLSLTWVVALVWCCVFSWNQETGLGVPPGHPSPSVPHLSHPPLVQGILGKGQTITRTQHKLVTKTLKATKMLCPSLFLGSMRQYYY